MKKAITLGLALTLLAIASALNVIALAQAPENRVQRNDSIGVFWDKFRAAVVKGNKVAVGGLSRFPIAMPYGMAQVRNRAQLTRRYRDVFHHETSAAKCFSTAQPEIDSARPKEFTVACKNSAGDEVIIYSFERTRGGWRFIGLDNINE